MLHFEVLVEDKSGKKMLECLIPKIIGDQATHRIIPYSGASRKIPPDQKPGEELKHRDLALKLRKLLAGYGKSLTEYQVVIVVLDLDDRKESEHRKELEDILERCDPRPRAYFCLAIEEGEAWLLGDKEAVKTAYSKAKKEKL